MVRIIGNTKSFIVLDVTFSHNRGNFIKHAFLTYIYGHGNGYGHGYSYSFGHG